MHTFCWRPAHRLELLLESWVGSPDIPWAPDEKPWLTCAASKSVLNLDEHETCSFKFIWSILNHFDIFDPFWSRVQSWLHQCCAGNWGMLSMREKRTLVQDEPGRTGKPFPYRWKWAANCLLHASATFRKESFNIQRPKRSLDTIGCRQAELRISSGLQLLWQRSTQMTSVWENGNLNWTNNMFG